MRTANLKFFTLILVVCFALVSCSGKTGNANGVPAASSSANAGNVPSDPSEKGAYPQEVVDEFMKSCVDSGANEKFCACMLDKVQAQYSLEEFSVIESKISNGTTPDEFVEFSGKARAQCVSR